MEFLASYGLFLLKVVTVVAGIVVIIVAAAAAGRKAGGGEGLEIENLNKKYESLAATLKQAVMNKSEWKAEAKAQKERDKAEAKSDARRKRAFVIDFKGDLKASAVQSLREEINAVLDVATADDEAVTCSKSTPWLSISRLKFGNCAITPIEPNIANGAENILLATQAIR